jgi:hypothetical protein
MNAIVRSNLKAKYWRKGFQYRQDTHLLLFALSYAIIQKLDLELYQPIAKIFMSQRILSPRRFPHLFTKSHPHIMSDSCYAKWRLSTVDSYSLWSQKIIDVLYPN